mmetsp:Transcript_2362/g.4274  ORF Transcript_2362/g.4274 Transcript_2362/m.4274 type:complete len:139 (+) Transcript_2362:2-418(+)
MDLPHQWMPALLDRLEQSSEDSTYYSSLDSSLDSCSGVLDSSGSEPATTSRFSLMESRSFIAGSLHCVPADAKLLQLLESECDEPRSTADAYAKFFLEAGGHVSEAMVMKVLQHWQFSKPPSSRQTGGSDSEITASIQ